MSLIGLKIDTSLVLTNQPVDLRGLIFSQSTHWFYMIQSRSLSSMSSFHYQKNPASPVFHNLSHNLPFPSANTPSISAIFHHHCHFIYNSTKKPPPLTLFQFPLQILQYSSWKRKKKRRKKGHFVWFSMFNIQCTKNVLRKKKMSIIWCI